MSILATFSVSAGLSIIAGMWLTPLARHVGLVDRPNERKQHEGLVPLVGGIAIFLTYAAVDFYLATPNNALLLAISLLICLGIIDDKVDLSAWIKLAGQTAAALIIVAFGCAIITSLGTLPGERELLLGPLALPVSVIAVVGLINAFNMIDGIDGLAGGLTVVALGNLMLAMHLIGRPLNTVSIMEIAIFCGAVSGYLILNLGFIPGRKIFLGDAGSMMLGLFVAFHLIDASQRQPLTDTLPTSLVPWMVAVPVLDTIRLIFVRLKKGQSPLAPDRSHIHHILLDQGKSPNFILSLLIAAGCLLFWFGYMIGMVNGLLTGLVFLILPIFYNRMNTPAGQ